MKVLRPLALPAALCAVGVAVGIAATSELPPNESLAFVQFTCYVTGIVLGAYRAPIWMLPIAAGAYVLTARVDHGVASLPSASIAPSLVFGTLAHVIRRAIRTRKISPNAQKSTQEERGLMDVRP